MTQHGLTMTRLWLRAMPTAKLQALLDDVRQAAQARGIWAPPLAEPPPPAPPARRDPAPRFILGGRTREAGREARFDGFAPHANRAAAALRPGNRALVERRTIFSGSVVDADASPRLLVSGVNSSKLGGVVRKGAWAGMPIYQLTLEERATCPRACHLWSECYGNAMPLARRHRHGDALVARLDTELAEKARAHPAGFVVRLHILGDFWSADYAARWLRWLDAIPQLHVFGYTAHPQASEIGRRIALGNAACPERWAIRFSVAPHIPAAPGQATTIWRVPQTPVVAEGIVCPAQNGRTSACATCGLCWAPAAMARRIVFIGHGKRVRGT